MFVCLEGLPGSDNSLTWNFWMFITCFMCTTRGVAQVKSRVPMFVCKYFVLGDHRFLLVESQTKAESRRYERQIIRVLYTTQKEKSKEHYVE
jgi:hypothetical protein